MIDSLKGFLSGISDAIKCEEVSTNVHNSNGGTIEELGISSFISDIFCPKCGGQRRANAECASTLFLFLHDISSSEVKAKKLPMLYKTTCLQCKSNAFVLIYDGPNGTEMALLHSVYGGCVTPHTPDEVKYYVDQGFRAKSVGANSACMAMYRSSLEWIFYDQGYTDGMVGSKIIKLENDIKTSKAPDWAKSIDPEFFKVLKNIGNGSIHTNGGDISKQNVLDNDLIQIVDVVFSELLTMIYEEPFKKAERLAQLKIAEATFNTK